jgi:hypothetical protein
MKYFFILFFTLALTLNLKGQSGFSIIFQPTDLGLGIRYDYNKILADRPDSICLLGGFVTASRGNYRFDNGSYINNHIKLVCGITFNVKQPDNIIDVFSAGIAAHYYGKSGYILEKIKQTIFYPLSLEFGWGIKLRRCVTKNNKTHFKSLFVGVNMDFFKWESTINLGYVF